jgi:hypothetical protein
VDLDDLRTAIDQAGVRPDSYDLDLEGFSLPSERYCIRREAERPG